MANHKSAVKRNRQTIKITKRNKSLKSRMRNTIRSLREAVKDGKEEKEDLLKRTASTISRLASKGVLHKRTASRKISRLAKLKK